MNEKETNEGNMSQHEDILKILKRMEQRLEYLEKKIDNLMGQSSSKPSFNRGDRQDRQGHFGRNDRPQQRSEGFRPARPFGQGSGYGRPRQDRNDNRGPQGGSGASGGFKPRGKSGFFHRGQGPR